MLEAEGRTAWYDQEADNITPQSMLEGVANAQHYVLYLSEGALHRPFVVYELAVATVANKPVSILHASGQVEHRRSLSFLKSTDLQPGTMSQIWSDELLERLWGVVELRRMIMRCMIVTDHASSSDNVRATWLAGRGANPLLTSIRTTVPLQRWATFFDGLMRRHSVIDDKTGAPLTAASLSLSIGSMLFLTYELSREAAHSRFAQVVRRMETNFIAGFTSQLLEVSSCERVAQTLVAGIRPPASGCLDKLTRSIFEVEHSAGQAVGRVDRRLDHAGRFTSSMILVLSSAEVAWQCAILQQLLLKDGFNVLCCPLAEGVEQLMQRRKGMKGVVLWLLSDGFLRDAEAATAAEHVAAHGWSAAKHNLAHVLVHEADDRKPRFHFDWTQQFAPLAARGHEQQALAEWLEAKLSTLESIPFERRSFLQRAMLETIEGRLESLAMKEGPTASSLSALDEEEAYGRRRRASTAADIGRGSLGGLEEERSALGEPQPGATRRNSIQRLALASSKLLRLQRQGRGASNATPSEVELSDEGARANRVSETMWSKLMGRLGRTPLKQSDEEAEDSLRALPAPRESGSVVNRRPDATTTNFALLDNPSPWQSEAGSFNQRDGSEAGSFSRPHKSVEERLTDVLQGGEFPDAPVSPRCAGSLELGQSISSGGALLTELLSEHLDAAPSAKRMSAELAALPLSASAPSPRVQPTATDMTLEGEDLQSWMMAYACVPPKYIDAVMAACDEQMICAVEGLATLQERGMLDSVFKPVIAAGIERALGSGTPSRGVSHLSSAASLVPSSDAPGNGGRPGV